MRALSLLGVTLLFCCGSLVSHDPGRRRLAFLIIRAVVPSQLQVESAMAYAVGSRRPSDPRGSGLSCLNHASPRVGD